MKISQSTVSRVLYTGTETITRVRNMVGAFSFKVATIYRNKMRDNQPIVDVDRLLSTSAPYLISVLNVIQSILGFEVS